MRGIARIRRRLVPSRADYKGTWARLARTELSARKHVAGDETFESGARNVLAALQATVGLRKTDTAIEIGCGVGRIGNRVAPLVREWVGCDVSPRMLRHARLNLADHPNVRLVEVSGWDLGPIPDQSVDLVYCTVVFMHLDEWDRYTYILEAHRVLRPEGRVYVDNFNLCTDEGWRVFEIHRTVFHPTERPAHISKSSTPQELETYLRRAGFRDVALATEAEWVRAFGRR